MPTTFFAYTGGYQTWKVPDGVTSVTVSVDGGGSGTNPGGKVTGKMAVTPGTTLWIVCGGPGKLASGESGGGTCFGGGGAGGDGNGSAGGDGGGGYSSIRVGSSTGTIKCVAGGAGGDSGDNGQGGDGGAATGGSGGRGTSGSNSTGNATGGTQSQGGNGGTSSSGSQFNGHNAADTVLAAYAGAGGSASNYCHGGGGGGGGYHQGGGGQASSTGYAPGGGGGGGSNYTGGLTGASSGQGTGGTAGGNVSITWVTPGPANQPPNTPTTAKVNGVDETPGYPTKSTGTVTVSAVVSDPDSSDQVLLLVRRSTSSSFSTYTDVKSALGTSNTTRSVTLTGLAQNTHYYIRLYAQDEHGLYSVGYNSLDFWTNRQPIEPTLLTPAENATVSALSSVIFTWVHNDPDAPDLQSGFELQYRTQATLNQPAGPWVLISQHAVTAATWTVNPGTFKGSTFYEWQVRTADHQSLWGLWSLANSFYVSSVSSPPVPLSPVKDSALDVNEPTDFTWRFVDPDPGDHQTKADLRYRLVGQPDSDWIMLLGVVDPGVPGLDPSWTLPTETFITGYHYEWQVRTYDFLGGLASDWSESGTFWAIGTPGAAVAGVPVQVSPLVAGALGCGTYRVFIYAQGGMQMLGEVTPMLDLTYGRVRDDISHALLHTNGAGQDCGGFYGALRCWMHELVIFRDGVREWEGPITRLTYQGDDVEIEAQDVMAYLYRRIMRQGYNDSYQTLAGQVISAPTVVARAQQIAVNALAPYDPNILPYLTVIQFSDDARESRVVADYSRTAFEEIDDLAATAGLDYTVVGRRIIMWDTHRSIGKLPEMRDGDFVDHPIITEYGMQLCNYSAVTNGSGVWAAVTPANLNPPEMPVVNGGFLPPGGPIHGTVTPNPVLDTRWWRAYGPIEMLASAYGEAAGGSNEVLTAAAKQTLVNAMRSQAQRNINDRWPTPVIVRIPDNSTLNPDVGITFDQFVPGVWVPIRARASLREVVQWQKLDSVTVNVDASGGEKVQVVMSPAPNFGEDPDAADAATVTDGG